MTAIDLWHFEDGSRPARPQAAAMALTIMVLCFAIIAGLERLARLALFRRW